MKKNKIIVYTIADENNKKYSDMMVKSLKHFHPDWPVHVVEGEELETYLKADPQFFYRATPIVAEKFINDYELVLKIDADSIITGDLSYVLNTKDYDIATVMNYNRIDPLTYGYVQAQGILPVEYMNAGFVAIRSEKFIKDWKAACMTEQFNRLQYREQDIMNFMIYYGNYNVRCLDHGDGVVKMAAWWGVVSKGEWLKAVIKDGKIIVPKSPDKFPMVDTEIKVIHFAGGNGAEKMNYKIKFNDEVSEFIDGVVK